MSDAPEPAGPRTTAGRKLTPEPAASREPRPMIERIGLAAIALVLALLFAAVAVASWSGGELFLAVMGAIGSLMTLWVGAVTLFRG